MSDDHLTFVVGSEKGVGELLQGGDVVPLLKGVVAAGASCVRVSDDAGRELWSARDAGRPGEQIVSLPILLEGEPVASLKVFGPPAQGEMLSACARLLRVALDLVLKNNLKRALTTEIHTTVVAESYQELVEKNRQLAHSEARYRELAENLELRVRERTAELKKAQAALLQKEKMAAVGQLAAGVAHEINNPLGFITSNLHTLQKYVSRLSAMIHFYRDRMSVAVPRETIEAEAEKKWRELKLNVVFEDVGDLLVQSLAGAERVSRIVADLKGFSHVDEAGETEVNLNQELERTLSVLSHQLGQGARVVRELEPLPPVHCPPQLPGQIFLNIIQNAIAACGAELRLTLTSAWDGKRIRIGIADNGPGVPQELRGRIFEPFFTTREVGAGAGMGLAVVYEAVQQLGGTVAVSDAAGGGAEFVITIPKG